MSRHHDDLGTKSTGLFVKMAVAAIEPMCGKRKIAPREELVELCRRPQNGRNIGHVWPNDLRDFRVDEPMDENQPRHSPFIGKSYRPLEHMASFLASFYPDSERKANRRVFWVMPISAFSR
jgi:hypothetical protein